MKLSLYRENGLWHFDDAELKITKEPFVLSATDAIDSLIGGPCNHATLEFSAEPFDGGLDAYFVRHENGGVIYTVGGCEAWLCPVFFQYFPEPPQVTCVRATPAASPGSGANFAGGGPVTQRFFIIDWKGRQKRLEAKDCETFTHPKHPGFEFFTCPSPNGRGFRVCERQTGKCPCDAGDYASRESAQRAAMESLDNHTVEQTAIAVRKALERL